MREINDLCQQVETGGQPAKSLDCIEQELQNLTLALQPPPSPMPTKPFIEVICQYMDMLCTRQKQTNLTNSLLQDIAVFNEHDSTKLEDIYEKAPQMLTDAILEVEKLNATQQLISTIIPPSMVNVMSHKEDYCFLCQEQGHIAQNCPHIRCYECNECGHIVMDCPHKIPPSGTTVTHNKPHRSHHARSSLRHHCDDRDRQSQSRSQSHF